MVKVIVEDAEGRKTVVPFIREEITIGRQEGNTIRLTERNISRHHARLFRQNGAILVEDLGSYNGIRINGARVEGKVAIHPGDLIQIGDYGLAIHDEAAAHSSAPSLASPSGVNGFSSARSKAKATPEIPLPARAPPLPEGATERTSAADEEITQEMRAKPALELKPEHSARLVLLNTEGAGRQFACTRAELKIGRSDENEFAIEDSSLSPTHARLRLDDFGEWHVIDLSSQGVLVNGEPYAKAALRSGDLLQLGNVKLRFIGRGAALALGAEPGKPQARRGNKLKLTLLSLSLVVLAASALFLLLTSKSAPVLKPESWRPIAPSTPAQPSAAKPATAAGETGSAPHSASAEPSAAPKVEPAARPTSPISAPPQLEAKPKSNPAPPRRDQGAPSGQDGRRSKEKEAKPTSAAKPDPKVREDRPAAPPRPAGAVLQKLYDEGTELYRKGKFAEAARALNECLKVDPNFPRCHMALGATYARLREPALGAEHYRRFIQLAPNDPEAGKVKIYLEEYESVRSSGRKD